MDFLEEVRKALGLADDATEAQVIEALGGRVALADLVAKFELEGEIADTDALVSAVKEANKPEPGQKSLADLAKEEGKVVIESAAFADLTVKAEKGAAAAAELHQTKFSVAFDKALDELRVDAKPETKDRYQKLYDASPETTVELLDSLPKIANGAPRGSGQGVAEAPDGVDPDSHALDLKVKAHMAEKNIDDYAEALKQVRQLEAAGASA
jgi:hypothetical protein